jgi:DNA invertase Pin-like site-specific DNA recombinase
MGVAGCEPIFIDKLSGAQVERPGLKEALSRLRQADISYEIYYQNGYSA